MLNDIHCRRHEASVKHCESVERWIHHTKSQTVDAQLTEQRKRDQNMNREALGVVMITLRYLGRQGLALLGHIRMTVTSEICRSCVQQSIGA